MSGLIGTGEAYQSQIQQAFTPVVKDETERNQENKMADVAHKQQTASMAGLGAATGYSIGAGSASMGASYGAAAGPIGAVAGAALGYLAGRLF